MLLDSAIVQFLVDPEVRAQVKPYLTLSMLESNTAKYFYTAICSNTFDHQVPEASAFTYQLNRINRISEEEVRECVSLLIGGSACETDEQIEQRISIIENFIRDSLFARNLDSLMKEAISNEGKEKYEDIAEAIEFDITTDSFIDFSNADMVIKSKEKELPPGTEIIKSKFGLINENSSYSGYKYGDVVMVSAETGIGKTTIMLNEGAFQARNGIKVCHVALGDMSEFDIACMYMSNWAGTLIENVILDFKTYHSKIGHFFKNLRVQVYPADTINIVELNAKLKRLKKAYPFDVLIIDYDANLGEMHDNIYKEGDTTYKKVKSFAQENFCVSIIASQIKPSFWGRELIPKDAPNDSSKKQMHVDYMLNLGRNPDARIVGTLNLAKSRRGDDEIQRRVHLNYAYKSIDEIPESRYETLKDQYQRIEQTNGTEGEDEELDEDISRMLLGENE